jgi:hypothetical protein
MGLGPRSSTNVETDESQEGRRNQLEETVDGPWESAALLTEHRVR